MFERIAIVAVVATIGCGEPRPIAEALDDVCPQRAQPDPETGDLALATLDFPGAVCNDGSPGALYVRRATDPAHINDWVIYLQAGGGCSDSRSCAARWCASVSRMSTEFVSQRQAGEGILSTDPRNSFAGYNHVSVHYCSSDFWSGDREDAATLRGFQSFTLLFRGHRILDGAIATLKAGMSSDDGSVELPPLDEADRVVFAGASAGGRGVGLNLDWFAEQLPEAQVIGLMDGFAGTAPQSMRDAVVEKFVANQTQEWLSDYVDLYDAFADRDCTGTAECIDAWYIQLDQLETPFVARRDLYDPLIAEVFVSAGASVEEVAQDLSESMRILAEERPGKAALFGPACGEHIITAAPDYLDQMVDGRTLDLLAVELLEKGETLEAIDAPDLGNSVCD